LVTGDGVGFVTGCVFGRGGENGCGFAGLGGENGCGSAGIGASFLLDRAANLKHYKKPSVQKSANRRAEWLAGGAGERLTLDES
jgi:hypothetical protein